MDNDGDLALGRREIEIQRNEALARTGLQVFEYPLITGVIGNYQLKWGEASNKCAGFVEWQNTAVVGQRMEYNDRILPRLNHFMR